MSTRPLLALFLAALVCTACGGETTPEEPTVAQTRGAVRQADELIGKIEIDKTAPSWKTELPRPPQFDFDAKDTYFWVLKTNQGTMRFQLHADVAPMHVSSTIYLTQLGFYDGVGFHRVIRDFMAQGGDPTGTGRGGPGYKYAGEFSPTLRHDKAGLLSMANAGPGTDGSQFFITFRPTPGLNDKHTIFGEIDEGMDVVEKLHALAPSGPAGGIAPTQPIVIEQATIEIE
jgi:cyclophilin family peptidyl-prolyl cis-trans isomerase